MDLGIISAPYEVRYKFVQTTMPSPTEDLAEAIYHTFDEFQSALAEKEILHPSEECHRQKWFASDSKVFDVINSYHVFCNLCQKHFYSRSVPTDINSFFEKHLNTDYHREVRDSMFPRSKEMISWEKVWVTGRCNVCQMSGLYATVKDMKCDVQNYRQQHLCFCNLNVKTNNLEFCRKLSLLKKFCKLSIFRDKFIKTLSDGNACLICCSKILWSGEYARIHLGSPKHMSRFFRLIYNRHNLSPKDLLNGFNLETVTRWIYNCVFKCPENLEADYEMNRIECFLASSAHLSLDYSAESDYYCPTLIEKLLDYQPSDFTRNDICLLCNLPTVDAHSLQSDHFDSEYHKNNLANLTAESFYNGDQYKAICSNRNSRLENYSGDIENYKQLKDGTHLHSLKVGGNYAEEGSMRKMFFKKLSLIKKPPPKALNGKHICDVCDIEIPPSVVFNHVTEFRHLYYLRRWQDLEKYAADSRFFEPFQKIKNLYICMLCGVCAKIIQFFHHLKGVFHAQRFKWYCTLDNKIPISSALEVRADFSVVCYLCDKIILNKQNIKDFKINLKTIRNHWPCLLVNKQEGEAKELLSAGENTEVACPGCGKSQVAHKSNCPTNSLNWKDVKTSIENIVDSCENAIFETVLDKTESSIDDTGEEVVEDMESLPKAACECEKSRAECDCGILNGDLMELEDSEEKLNKIESKDLKNDETEDEEKMEEAEQEVLIISDLPLQLQPSQRYEILASICKKYGMIQGIHFEKNFTKVIFTDQGVADRVAASVKLFPNSSPPVTMTVKRKGDAELENKESSNAKLPNRISSSKSKLTPMPAQLLELMQEPTELVKFVSSLTAAATAAATSSEELKREEMVCATINNAVQGLFPQCRCYPFGSRLSGLVLSDSDLDVFLDCGGMYEGTKKTSPAAERNLIHSVAKLLRKKKEVTHLVIIDRARVPIVSFFHQNAGLHCDLSVKNALSVHNTLLIKFLTSLDVQVKNIVIFFKYWVKQNGIQGPPYFSSYAITMMAIFYLQQLEPPMVPTVEKLQNAFVGRRLTIGGWDCSFSEDAEGLVNKGGGEFPLHVILQGFFDYFANFEYDKFAISPLDGKPLPREAFSSSGKFKLPMCYKKHILNLPQPIEKLVCQSIPICVFDPFDLSHVLTKSFTPAGLEMFKSYCQLSAAALKMGALNIFKE